MNNEDAIYFLLRSNEYHHAKGDLPHSAASIEAFNKAVDALKAERPQGEWITKEHSIEYYCSHCGERLDQCCENFCCHCGAQMKGDNNE